MITIMVPPSVIKFDGGLYNKRSAGQSSSYIVQFKAIPPQTRPKDARRLTFQDISEEFLPVILNDIMLSMLAESADAGHKTVSFATLTSMRLVSKQWNDAVDGLRSLIATPSFLVLNNGQRPWSSATKFYERMQVEFSRQDLFEIVSFNLCTRFLSPETGFDDECAKKFLSALTNCRAAEIAIELSENELKVSETPVRKPQVEQVELRKFSWKSVYMGIRHVLPGKYGFPSGWETLKQCLPWEQLTHVDLDCPLSISDVFFVLQCGSSKLQVARLATVQDAATGPHLHLSGPDTIKLDSLESLTIHSQLALDDLFPWLQFSKSTRLSLKLGSGLFSTCLRSILNLTYPWQQINQIELDCLISINDAYLLFSHGRRNLKHVHLATIEMEGTAQIQQHPILTMSSLVSLVIHSRVNLHDLFSRLRLPALIRLALTLNDPDAFSDLSPTHLQQHGTFASHSNLHARPPMLSSNLNVPWYRLRYLDITYNCWQICAMTPILSNCSRLDRLSIASSTSGLQFSPDPPIRFPAEIELGLGIPYYDVLRCLGVATPRPITMKVEYAPSAQAIQLMGEIGIAHLIVVEAITTPLLSKVLRDLQGQLTIGKFRIKEAKRSELDLVIGGIQAPYAKVEVSRA